MLTMNATGNTEIMTTPINKGETDAPFMIVKWAKNMITAKTHTDTNTTQEVPDFSGGWGEPAIILMMMPARAGPQVAENTSGANKNLPSLITAQ